MQRKTEALVIGVFAAVILLAVVLAAFLSGGASPSQTAFKATTVTALAPGDWTRGAATTSLSVIEYGDFECPACAAYEPIVEKLTQEYGGKVVFAFRNFPLYQTHPDAMISAQAAEAAGLQGKYWQMHDLLYLKQSEWTAASPGEVVPKYFDGYARSLGLAVAKFDADIASGAVKNKVQRDINGGNAAGIDHTPTFFIGLAQIPNPSGYAQFKADIEAALASSTAR